MCLHAVYPGGPGGFGGFGIPRVPGGLSGPGGPGGPGGFGVPGGPGTGGPGGYGGPVSTRPRMPQPTPRPINIGNNALLQFFTVIWYHAATNSAASGWPQCYISSSTLPNTSGRTGPSCTWG